MSEVKDEGNMSEELEDAMADDWNDRRKTKADVRREWSHLVEQTEIDYGIYNQDSHRSGKSECKIGLSYC